MDKWLKTGTLKRSASRTEIRTTDLAAMEITVDQQDDNHEVQRSTDWPAQGYFCGNEMDWTKCCGVCTDGGKSISGCYKGVRGRIKIVAPHAAWSHCCIHRKSLATKPLPNSLKEVLNQSVEVVNFIKANSTNTRLFKSLCGDMGSLHTTLLLHTEVRWLSRGNVFSKLLELHMKFICFLKTTLLR
ncbi:Zinc finger BED domain-containing protein 5 [Araneus ventricosus]|uniref:Zinc finger BED domain-containing protein 5 n=1 Tax=Araneus ventricosus TaxID=182803 RepID=A0A4Y2DZQ6_ARAVE|nr:Zinc finger BED domain-containing protein 5 [Araneus ventricosus]